MSRLPVGTHFGSYVVEGFLGSGGMGEVYAARHGVYGSVVALKVLHQKLHDDEGWRFRFNEEGLVGTRLKHPHVLSARELVEHNGRVALVLDLVRGGQTLQKVMSRDFSTGLPLPAALRLMLGIVQGVEYLHDRRIVHGDIKPENVLIEGEIREPRTWVPRVTDFGTVGLLARPVIIGGRAAVVASPRYASPEHFDGVDKLEARSDIYSLGLVLYYLVTGQHASSARTVEEAAARVRDGVPAVGLVDIPEPIVALITLATLSDVDDRLASCRSFALALRDILDELGVALEVDDVKSDLATEVIEERQRMRAAAVAREAELSEIDIEEESGAGVTARVPDAEAYVRAAAVEEPDLGSSEVTPVAPRGDAEMTLVPDAEQLDALERMEARLAHVDISEDTEIPTLPPPRRTPPPAPPPRARDDDFVTTVPDDRSIDDPPTRGTEGTADEPMTLGTENLEHLDLPPPEEHKDTDTADTADTLDDKGPFAEPSEDAATASSEEGKVAESLVRPTDPTTLGFQRSNPSLRIPDAPASAGEPIPAHLWAAIGVLALVALVAFYFAFV